MKLYQQNRSSTIIANVVKFYSCLTVFVILALANTAAASPQPPSSCHKIYGSADLATASEKSLLVQYLETLAIKPRYDYFDRIELPLAKNIPQNLRQSGDDPNTSLGFISYQFADVHNFEIDISLISIKSQYRKQGVADFLYRLMIQSNPQVRVISRSLVDTNLDVFVQTLISELSKHKNFDQAKLNAYKRQAEKYFRENGGKGVMYNSADLFETCCSQISLRDYPSGLVERAIRATPSFRATRKLGFNKIIDIQFNPISLNTYDVAYSVERKK